MGEQTQTQSPPDQSQPTSNTNSISSPPPPPPSPPQPPLSEFPVDLAKNPSNPCKIPIRPQKIRKLSTTSIPSSATTSTNTSPKPVLENTNSSSSPPSTAGDTSKSTNSIVTSNVSGGTTTSTTISATSSTPKNRRRSGFQASRVLPQIIRPLSAEGEIELALRHLRSVDPLVATLIDTHPPPVFESHQLPFLALAKSILYQQLALKAGTSIYTRFVALCGGEEAVRPDAVLALSTHQLKQIGVSGRKSSYLYDLANKYKNGILSDETVVKMDDRSLFTMLSMVKGIGSWSVHMFMIFSLHRPDVLPVSDLAVRKGVQLLYGLEELPRPSQMEQLCEKWRPYRSVGAWYMWRFVEGKGATTNGAAVVMEGNNVQPLQQIEPEHDAGQQHQLQFVEPINGMGSLGACVWESDGIS